MKTISFLFPAIGNRPIGGYKVVYEYANRLVSDGYHVKIVYPAYMYIKGYSPFFTFLRICKAILRYLYCMMTKWHSCRNWFNLDSRVEECLIWSLKEKYTPATDVYIATSVRTAFCLKEYVSDITKMYLIQHFEDWGGVTAEEVISTYKYGFKNILISKWLQKIVSQHDPQCTLIPNGFDFEFFQRKILPEQRDKFCLAMLYHTQELKGCADGFKALGIVKSKYPQLHVNLFGVPSHPQDLPDWYCYYQQPDRETFNKLYNEAAIFVGTSWSEGWGLTVGEAMICGCAIVCTDNDGYREMVEDGVTALISPIKDPQRLADNIIRLIENDALRYELANRGHEHIKKFNWERSYAKLRNIIDIEQ